MLWPALRTAAAAADTFDAAATAAEGATTAADARHAAAVSTDTSDVLDASSCVNGLGGYGTLQPGLKSRVTRQCSLRPLEAADAWYAAATAFGATVTARAGGGTSAAAFRATGTTGAIRGASAAALRPTVTADAIRCASVTAGIQW